MGLPRLRTTWLLLAFVAWGGVAHCAPVTFNTDLPVTEGMFVFRELFVIRQSRGHNRKASDRLALDASWRQRLWPRRLTSGLPGFLYGVLEVNGSYQWHNHVAGRHDPDSGGWRLFLTPGLQVAARRWVVEGVVQLPVVQDLNGRALEDDWIVRAGFRIAF
ncbi:hypothetical protein [Methylothermus subterraneus]